MPIKIRFLFVFFFLHYGTVHASCGALFTSIERWPRDSFFVEHALFQWANWLGPKLGDTAPTKDLIAENGYDAVSGKRGKTLYRDAAGKLNHGFQGRGDPEMLPHLWLNELPLGFVLAAQKGHAGSPLDAHFPRPGRERNRGLDLDRPESIGNWAQTALVRLGLSWDNISTGVYLLTGQFISPVDYRKLSSNLPHQVSVARLIEFEVMLRMFENAPTQSLRLPTTFPEELVAKSDVSDIPHLSQIRRETVDWIREKIIERELAPKVVRGIFAEKANSIIGTIDGALITLSPTRLRNFELEVDELSPMSRYLEEPRLGISHIGDLFQKGTNDPRERFVSKLVLSAFPRKLPSWERPVEELGVRLNVLGLGVGFAELANVFRAETRHISLETAVLTVLILKELAPPLRRKSVPVPAESTLF